MPGRDQLVHKAIQLLDVDEVKLQATIDEMLKVGEIVKEGTAAIYLPQLRYCEIGIAGNLDRLMTKPKGLKAEVAKIEAKLKISYDPLQADAIMSAMNAQVMVLTGGPGTGKNDRDPGHHRGVPAEQAQGGSGGSYRPGGQADAGGHGDGGQDYPPAPGVSS